MNVAVVGTSPNSRGGIATVLQGYRAAGSAGPYAFTFVVSHEDGNALHKSRVALRALREYEALCRSGKVDICHIHTADRASLVRLALFCRVSRRHGVPVVNHVHCADWDRVFRSKPARVRAALERIYRMPARTIALSQSWKDNLAEAVDPATIDVLPNFIESAEKNTAPLSNQTVLFTGRFEPIKGVDELPAVIASVAAALPNVRFVCIGDGSRLEPFRQAVARLGLQNNVETLGWVDHAEVMRRMRAANLVFLPSWGEGLPMSVLEGIACGKPVVSTPVGGIPDVVSDANGILCAPGDVAAFAAAITSILSDEKRYRALSQGSYEIALEHAPAAYFEKLARIYDSMRA
jgi:glycosyltransferase involved in cell wall biosynthesis